MRGIVNEPCGFVPVRLPTETGAELKKRLGTMALEMRAWQLDCEIIVFPLSSYGAQEMSCISQYYCVFACKFCHAQELDRSEGRGSLVVG